jgi:hypothetical protein
MEHVVAAESQSWLLAQTRTVTDTAVLSCIDSFNERDYAGRTFSLVHLLNAFFLEAR